MNLNVPDSGSKVNGLEQLFHPLEGSLSPIARSRWRLRWWRNGTGMKWPSGGSERRIRPMISEWKLKGKLGPLL